MKPIPNFLDYFADENGNVYSMKPLRNNAPRPIIPRLMKPIVFQRDKRYRVHLSKDGIIITRSIASLILETFVSIRIDGMFACHGIHGNQDDSIDNVYWGTSKQNAIDRRRDGTMADGEKAYQHKITEKDVRFIRENYSPHGKNGISQLNLAKMFHLHRSHILKITKHEKWKHI